MRLYTFVILVIKKQISTQIYVWPISIIYDPPPHFEKYKTTFCTNLFFNACLSLIIKAIEFSCLGLKAQY